MALPKVGVEAVIEGMAAFEADSKKVNKAFDDMNTGASKLGKGASGLTSMLTSLGSSILKIGAVAGGAALVGVTALAGGLATFAAGGIKQAIDLDQQVANIAATMGATTETAGTLKDELKGLALDLSLNPNLTVDVTQAGEAIEVLAANGALATDEFGKLTEASKDLAVQTVALANATGSDFTTAATIATDAMALFGLEANEMGKAVDGAAGIMNASKFSAQDYQLALSNAGGIAAEMGISLEDFNTVLAGTASNFASGSDAGTSFKTLMQRLANPTDEVKAAMQQYGISLFDANGEMRSMADIAQDLNQVFNGTVTVTSQVGGATKEQAKAAEQASAKMGDLTRDIGENRDKLKLMTDVYQESLKFYDAGEPKMRAQALAIDRLTNNITDQEEKLAGYNAALAAVDGAQARTITSTQELTEAQKAQLAATLGGADGSRILLGLADLTAAEFDALSESVNRSGQGLEAAALRVDTVKGAMDIFKGVLQAIQIQVGDAFLPLLKELAVSMTQFATENGPMIVDFFKQVASSIDLAIAKGMELFAAFQQGGAGGLLTAMGLGDVVTMWATVQPILAQLQTWLGTNIPAAIKTLSDLWNNNLLPGFTQIFDAINSELLPAFNQLSGALLGATGGTQSFSELWTNTLLPALMTVGAFVRDVLFPAWVDMQVFFIGALSVAITTLADYWTNYLFPAITTVANFVTGTVIPALSDLWDWLGPKLSTSIQALSDLWTGTLQPALITVFDYSSRNLIPLLESIGNLFNAVINVAIRASAGLWQNILFPALKKVGDFLNATFFPAFQSVGKTVNEDVSPVLRDLGEVLLPMVQEGMDLVNEAVQRTISFFNSLASTITDITLPDWLQMHSPPPLATALDIIAGSAGGANAAITEMMDSLASNRWDQIRGDVLDLVDDMQDEGFYRDRGFGKSTGHAIKHAFIRAFTKNFQGILSGNISGDVLRALTQNEAGAYAERVTGDFNKIVAKARAAGGQMLQELKQELLEALPAAAGGLSSVASQFAEMLEPQMSDRAKFIKKMQDFLASGSDELFRFDFAPALVGTDHVMLNRLRTQEQLNYLLAEQRKQEIEITKQKEAQQKLTFLQAQIDLIKIGRELGGNVFQGITFGLHASAEDLLRATNNVVEAMIGQINTTLEIGSPSQIMVEVGQQIMAGLQRGIVSMTPTLNAQLSASVMGPLSPVMAGAMSAGATTNNYNTFQVGGNTISNGVDAATFEARVLQVIRRNL